MADYTIPAIVAIVFVVLLSAVALSGIIQQPTMQTPTGQVTGDVQEQQASLCEPKRFCDGSKLTLIRDDCSVNYAYCQYGCSDASCI